MAKRTKKAKNSRSNLKVESLEQRQLLAQIVGGGVEVLSDFTHSNGNVYDQVLMTGPSVTVTPDPGQIVRVSFLDQGGDIVQAEFAGAGTMTITLEDLKRAGDAGYTNPNPAQTLPNGGYVQGLASITIDKSELNTNLNIFAAGNLQNPGFFSKDDGDNGLADIARVILVGNEKNNAGFTNMGSIIAGSAVFSAETGVVGIRGENVAVQGKIVIGDIDAKGSGVPTLLFNSNSQFQNVTVRGGDLRQSNGTSFDSFGAAPGGPGGGSPGDPANRTIAGFSFFNSTDGQAANTDFRPAVPVNASAIRLAAIDQQTLMSGDWTYDWTNPQDVKVTQNGTDVSKYYGGDWLAKGGVQSSIDYAFERRTFLGNITVTGDLPAGIEMNLADARANVTFNNNFYGSLIVDGFGASIDGTLEVKGNLDGTVVVQGLDRANGIHDGQQNVLNALLVGGSTGPFTDVRAEDINSVTIRNNFSGIISTDVSRGSQWTPSQRTTGGAYVDVEGKIGNVSIGYNAAGASTGGSIVNGSIQGMSGIGNVKVGGDIYGSPALGAVFSTDSNPGAAPTDVGRYGSANIGNIDVRGDVDLDSTQTPFIRIGYNGGDGEEGFAGNGTYGNITVQGLTTTNTIPGEKTGTETVLIPGSESFVRILSPFTDVGFTVNPALGQKLVTNYDPDGVLGELDDTYFVTANDVKAGAQVYDLNTKAMVAAKVGDRVPALAGGAPIIDAFGNVLYRQNTALYEGKTEVRDVFGPPVTTIVSGNRGNLDGVFNNFGSVIIYGLLGAQQKTTGTISITDSVDMTFGGVQIMASGDNNQNVIGTVGTIGAITINNTSGATADLQVTGPIGSPAGISSTNSGTSHIGLAGFNSSGFEDVLFGQGEGGGYAFHVTNVGTGISVSTVTGVGNGTGPGTVSPSVTFDSLIALDNGTSEATQTALLNINTGSVNSQIVFNSQAGILVDDGGNTGNGSKIGDINLSSDYVKFAGQLTGRSFGNITLTGGQGINSGTDTAVSFTGHIAASSIGAITASATEGNVVFAPADISGIGTKGTNNGLTPVASIGSITLTTAGTNNGGDISFGNGAEYDVNVSGAINITAGHKLFVNQAGTVIDNPGNVNINFVTSGNIGNLTATTTTGDINNVLTVKGNAGDITYTAGAAVVSNLDDVIGGPGVVGDLARFGSITANQTIWGSRGVTTFETYGQNADGTAKTLPEFTVNEVAYNILPTGSIDARLNYAGGSTASGDAFIAKSGGGNITVNYNIIGHDDNNDGTIAISEIGHGGNVNVNSISGDIRFFGGTDLPGYTHVATLGNVTLATGVHPTSTGVLNGSNIGSITLGFNALDTVLENAPNNVGVGVQSTGGFEGSVGNITATTVGGNIHFGGLDGALQNVGGNNAADYTNPETSVFNGKVGNVTLTAGSVAHTAGVAVGNISTPLTYEYDAINDVWVAVRMPVTFNAGQGLVKATVTDVGEIDTSFNANGPAVTTGNGFEFNSQYGDIVTTIGAGRYDANNNGIITANEYGRSGNVLVTTSGGNVELTLNSNAYASTAEQSGIGNVTVNTTAYVDVKNGQFDVIGMGTSPLGSAIAGANGNIAIIGANTQRGSVGNLVATTNTGTITHTGVFGDLGTSSFTTDKYLDLDTDPNSTSEAPVLIGNGNIVLGTGFNVGVADALRVNGKHGASTYTVVENGTISGTAYYGGAAIGESSLTASSVRGNINLSLWLQDVDRDNNGAISASEYGTFGSSKLTTTSGGDVNLMLGTEQNAPAVVAKNLIPQFTFGAVEVKVADRYTSTSASAADVLADAGNITINGVGGDASNGSTVFGPYTGNRGNVASIKADTVRGNISLGGVFGGLGNQDLTVTRYVDDRGANDDTHAGNINYSPTILGTHGTATLRTTDLGATGTGTINGGAINGVATFGGAAANTVSVDAKTERANINLDVIALGYDINGDGKITDGVDNNVPGDFEFAKVGDVLVQSTSAGDITLGIGIATADGSKVGSSIGNVTAISDVDLYTSKANANDAVVSLGNVTVIGKSPAADFSAGKIGALTMTVNSGDATLRGNFGSISGVTINTGTYEDQSDVNGNKSIIAAGDIILGNAGAGDFEVADTAGLNTLNIAGTTGASTFTVTNQGTIKGEVFVAGTGGGSWTLQADRGAATAATATANGASGVAIDVNFVAGFDANDGDGNQRTGIDNGTIGDITAMSTFGDVIIGVGGRTANSSIGNVTVSTGSSIVEVAGADKFTHGNAEIQGVSSHRTAGADTTLGTNDDPLVFAGSVGNLSATTAYGQARITGDFNNIGAVSLSASAKVDVDTDTSVANEDPVVTFAGDVFFGTNANPVYVGGTSGAITLSAVDSSVLAAGLAGKSAGLVANTGDVSATAFFAGAGNAFTATTNRGTIDVDLELGFDKDNAGTLANGGVDNNRNTGEDAASLTSVTLTSIDGNIFATLDSSHANSTYGAVTATTGSTITAASGADTTIATGNIVIDGDNDGETTNGNLGSIASITATTSTGDISLTGKQWNVGAITLTAGSSIDTDPDSTSVGEDPIVNAAGDITVGLTIMRNHGTVTLTAGDIATAGLAPAADKGNISGSLSFAGNLTGGTSSVVATTQQGDISLNISSITHKKASGDPGVTVDSGTSNSDDFAGAVGDVVFTSLFGDITVGLNTSSIAKIPASSDAIRFSSIGNVTASTGSSYLAQAGSGNDTEQLVGNITIAGVGSVSDGILGNIKATTTTGDVSFGVGGKFNNVVGNVELTAGNYTDTISYKAGNVAFGGEYATTNNNSGDYDTTLGTVKLTAVGTVDNLGAGAAGNVTIDVNFGGKWFGDIVAAGNTAGFIDAGEQAIFTGGAINATVTDGVIDAQFNSETGGDGFGAALPTILLKSTGGSTAIGTGDVVVSGGSGTFSSIASFEASAVNGDVAFLGSWETPLVTSFKLTSDKGDVTFDGDLLLDTADAKNFDTAQAKIVDFLAWAKDGRVFVGDTFDVGAQIARLGTDTLNRQNASTATDTRTFELGNITFKAAGSGANLTGPDNGTITVDDAQIGGAETTNIANLKFDVPTLTGSTKLAWTAPTPAQASVLAHDIGTIQFDGNAELANGTRILASDVLTGRNLIGNVDYSSIGVGTAANKGANLDIIGELIFNGSVAGNATASLITGNRAEIEASSIGRLTINAPVDPTTTVKYSVKDLDILTSNARGGVAQGEALRVLGFSSVDSPNAITAFAIGDVSITHSLQGNSTGSAVFEGSNSISALGGMGNLTIKSTLSGSVQAPLLTPTGGAWFSVGDGDGLNNTTANVDANGNLGFVAYADVNTTAGVAGDKVSIGAVSIDVGSTYTPPAVQTPTFGNIGGNNASATDGLVILAAAIAPTVGDTAATRAAAYTELYGYIASVEIKNAAIRPDANGTDFAVTAGAALPAGVAAGDGNAGALIAVAGDNSTSTADIGDIINDLDPALVPLNAGEGRVLGLAGASDAYDQGDVVVYVL